MKKLNRGMSLVEVLVAVSIIIALVGILMPALSIVRTNSNRTEASSEIAQLDTALMAYFSDNGYFPATGQMVASLNNKYFSFSPSRLNGTQYSDPFGNPYYYWSDGSKGKISLKGYDLFSVGLLLSQKATDTLGQILGSFSSSSGSSVDPNMLPGNQMDIVVGHPTGLDSVTIWGLPEPTFDGLVLSALGLLSSTDQGFNLYGKIQLTNVPIEWADLSAQGALALYNDETHLILLDFSLQSGPMEAVAAIIGHEGTHLSDNLSNGDRYFDSIQEEYDAFYNAALVWEQLSAEGGDTIPDNWLTQEMNFVLAFIQAGEEVAKETIRQSYGGLPENEEYGDGYVVPKRF